MLPFRPDVNCPLDGISVLDLSRLVAGNMLSLQLADFGAEVIKVEDPDHGDPLRAWRVEGHSLFWKVYARNKKSITLDLRKSRAKALLLDLAQRSHVLIENFRPGTLERMGFGPATLQARNPRLVIVRVSGWGQTGPYACRDTLPRPAFQTVRRCCRPPRLPIWWPGSTAPTRSWWRCARAKRRGARVRSSICRCWSRSNR